jgi:spore germination protein KB
MLQKEKITKNQFAILVMMFTVGSSILILPSGLAAEAKQDAWIAALLAIAVGVALVVLYTALGNRYSTMTLPEYSEIILGKWLGKIVSILYFAFFFLLSALVLRNIGDFLNTYELPHTPFAVTHIVFLLVVIMSIRLGLETFSRSAEFFFPWVIALILVLLFAIVPQIEFKNLQPIMGEGVKPIIRASIPFVGSPILELVVFLMIIPAINRKQGGKMGFLTGYLIGGTVLFIASIITILVLGVDVTSRKTYPSYTLAKQINIGNFIQRIEAIASFIWFITIFIKLSLSFYASTFCLAHILKLKDYRVVIFPLAIIMLILSLVAYPNTAYFLTFVSATWPFLALMYGLILPLLLFLISSFTKKRVPKT